MIRKTLLLTMLLILPCSAAFAQKTQLITGIGKVHHSVTSSNPEAQKYFDQGLAFLYGFNHDEAARSFQRAAELDPAMGMAWWGIAKALGPNYNLAVDPEREKQAWQAIQKAGKLGEKNSPLDRDYISALATRFSDDPAADFKKLNVKYREAMRGLAAKYPDDLNAATLFAEAGMDVNPWQLWNAGGAPASGTAEIVSTLESVLQRDPHHLGANHFYIHAVEASRHPDRALPSAERLAALAPASGHLVHMPAHTFIRTGDFEAAMRTNESAVTVDDALIKATGEQGIYPMMYYTHNLHFIVMADAMLGRYQDSLRAAHRVQAHIKDIPMLEGLMALPAQVMVRFGRWNEILNLPAPGNSLPVSNGMWHYARAMAFAAGGNEPATQKELTALRKFAPEMARTPTHPAGPGNAQKIPQIAAEIIQARLASALGNKSAAIRHLQAAVALQDAMDYNEPAEWFHPVRESLGAALLLNGQPAEAEKVFRDDLQINPRNGRSLFGLRESLKAQGKMEDANIVNEQFQTAWQHADASLNVGDL